MKISYSIHIHIPLIYFDTCAYDLFFKDEYLSEKARFIQIMNKKKATLMVSFVNLIELAGRLKDEDINKICQSLDEIGEVKIIDANPDEVIDRERSVIENNKGIDDKYYPACDERLMKWFQDISNWEIKNCIIVPPKISDLLRRAHDEKKEESKKNRCVLRYFDKLVLKLKEAYDRGIKVKNKELQKIKARIEDNIKKKGTKNIAFFTEEILSLAINFILGFQAPAKTFKEDKDWFDVFHAIVPTTYCHFIFLDKRWKHFREQLKTNYNLSYPEIAKVYIFNKQKFKVFLDNLVNFNPSFP